ncbi:uncharacterized protein ACOB7L_008245 [Callospermophilus lateralis]|uniref:uncharacterized protein LOC143641423 n=1 Tax=Callospermophilus lateralis TaxID=76772 RepID=UPI00405456A7
MEGEEVRQHCGPSTGSRWPGRSLRLRVQHDPSFPGPYRPRHYSTRLASRGSRTAALLLLFRPRHLANRLRAHLPTLTTGVEASAVAAARPEGGLSLEGNTSGVNQFYCSLGEPPGRPGRTSETFPQTPYLLERQKSTQMPASLLSSSQFRDASHSPS